MRYIYIYLIKISPKSNSLKYIEGQTTCQVLNEGRGKKKKKKNLLLNIFSNFESQ